MGRIASVNLAVPEPNPAKSVGVTGITFQHKMGEPRWVHTFTRANRPGSYLRVLEPGEVWAGDPVIVEDRPAHGVTIARAFRAYLTEPHLLAELVEIDGLPNELRESLAKRLRR